MEFYYSDHTYDSTEKVLWIKDGVKTISLDMFSRFHDPAYATLYREKNFKVIIPNSVERLDYQCFLEMRASEYQIPDSVKEISFDVFEDNKFLKSIQWPSSVKVISDGVFRACTNLEEVVLPEGLEVIGDCAFQFCEMLSKISIPTTVKKIGDNAFYSCSGLQSLSVPVNVEKIERAAFFECRNLEMVELHEGLLEIDNLAFAWCENLTTITIPTTVESLGTEVFKCCKKLKEIYVPKALYDKYGKDYIKDDTPVEVIPYNEPMVKNAITNSKTGKENTEIVLNSKKEFKSFCGTIRTNLIADKRKK